MKNRFSRFVARRSNIAAATLLVMLASQGPIWAQLKPKLPPTGDVYAVSCELLFPTSEEKVEACIIGTCVNTHLNDDPAKFEGNVRKCNREADKWRKTHPKPKKDKKGQKKASAKKVAAE